MPTLVSVLSHREKHQWFCVRARCGDVGVEVAVVTAMSAELMANLCEAPFTAIPLSVWSWGGASAAASTLTTL